MEGILELPNKETLIGVFDKFSSDWIGKVIKIYQNGQVEVLTRCP